MLVNNGSQWQELVGGLEEGRNLLQNLFEPNNYGKVQQIAAALHRECHSPTISLTSMGAGRCHNPTISLTGMRATISLTGMRASPVTSLTGMRAALLPSASPVTALPPACPVTALPSAWSLTASPVTALPSV
jgi:hypothetical protein